MEERVILKRYASAIFELGIESNKIEEILKDLQTIVAVDKQVPFLIRALSDERVSLSKRISALENISVLIKIGNETLNILKILISKGRLKLLNLVVEDLILRICKRKELAITRVHVADASFVKDICMKLEDAIGKTLHLDVKCEPNIDESLIGGFVAWLGNVRYDASIKGRLERMREEFYGNSR